MKEIYLDNAAASPILPRVQRAMRDSFKIFGNPSSFNDAGRLARTVLKEARLIVARFLGAHQDEIIFTGSGSESNNLAIFGVTNGQEGGEIITTPIEHPSVRQPMSILSRRGFKVRELPVDKDGIISIEDVKRLITKKTKIISVMYANNEIGTIEPVSLIGKYIKKWREANKSKFPIFHVDACQAIGYLNCNVNHLGVDLLTFNGSKIGGPRGIGVLYVRRGISIQPFVSGGDQEHGLRAGTENTQAIIGLAEAVKSLKSETEGKRLVNLRDYFIEKIMGLLPEVKLSGAIGRNRLPSNIHISLPGITSENILVELDKYGIRAGSGSACTSRSVEPSHVLKAIKLEKKYLTGALRISMGWQTNKKDIDYLLKVLPKAVGAIKRRYSL